MAFDSQTTKPPSSMVGTVPLGFIARYDGVSTTPYGSAPVETCPSGPIVPLASVSSNSTSASVQAQRTRCVQIEFGRPQILTMATARCAFRYSERICHPVVLDHLRYSFTHIRIIGFALERLFHYRHPTLQRIDIALEASEEIRMS